MMIDPADFALSESASDSCERRTRLKKRVSRACDECRLHKTRCDGTDPCGTCRQHDRVCSFNLRPAECQGSSARIRILEQRLVKARECIDELHKQVPRNTSVDVKSALAPQSVFQSDSLVASSQTLVSDATVNPTNGLGFSLVASLLGPLMYHERVRSLVSSNDIRSALRDPRSIDDVVSNRFCQLPLYLTMIEVVYAAFTNVFGLASILSEQDFRVSAQRLYDIEPISYTDDDTQFVPLFCAVVALGMICCSKIHKEFGYDIAVQQSLLYLNAARHVVSTNEDCRSWLRLRLTLCVVLYFLYTSKMDLARSALEMVCTSDLVRSSFRTVAAQGSSTPAHMHDHEKNMVWLITYLDMNTSSLLDLSPLLSTPDAGIATVYAINIASHNVANYKRSDTTFLLSVSIAMGIELTKLIQRMRRDNFVLEPQQVEFAEGQQPTMLELQKWHALKEELDTWEHIFMAIFPENENNPTLASARAELQLRFYMAQITLYSDFLVAHLKHLQMGNASSIHEIERAEAGFAVAIKIATYIAVRLEQTQSAVLSSTSAYTLFVASIILLEAISWTDALLRHRIEHATQIALWTLQRTEYGSRHSKSCYVGTLETLCSVLGVTPSPYITDGAQSLTDISIATSNSSWSDPSSNLNSPSSRGPIFSQETQWPAQWPGEVPEDHTFNL